MSLTDEASSIGEVSELRAANHRLQLKLIQAKTRTEDLVASVYQATRDVKVVQETLRHSDISTAAKYSHVEERKKARYTSRISIKTE